MQKILIGESACFEDIRVPKRVRQSTPLDSS